MTITCDTSLDAILDHTKVDSIVLTSGSDIRKITSKRMQVVGAEIRTDAIKNGLIDGSNVMFTKGSEVKDGFATFHLSLCDLESEIKSKAKLKETEELEDLVKAIDLKLSDLYDEETGLKNKLETLEDGSIEEEKASERLSTVKGDIRKYEDKKTQANARLKKLGVNPASADTSQDSPETTSAAGMTHQQHTEYSIVHGDSFNMNGKTYEFYATGKSADGTTYMFVSGEDGTVYLLGADGTLTATDHNSFSPMIHLQDEYPDVPLYTAYTTNSENAAALGLPSQENITPTPETWDSDVYVDYGQPNPEDVVHVSNSVDLHEAAANHAPVITIDATKLEDNQNLWQYIMSGSSDVEANEGTSQITLVYNESTGSYFPMDSTGGYEVSFYVDLTPEKLQNFTIEI